MSDKVRYTVEKNRTSSKQIFTLMVPRGGNLLEWGYQSLQTDMILAEPSKRVPMYAVYDAYAITGVEIVEEPCEGCREGYPGQKGHMECPGGCLHDSENCDVCDDSMTDY